MTGVGIDLGTANTVVCDPRRGIIFDEPSVMVVRGERRRRPRIVAFGHEARVLVGRVPQGLVVVRPMLDGVVTDLETTRAFIRRVVRGSPSRPWRFPARRAVIGVPAGATTLERRALLEAAEEARIRKVDLIAEPVAGAFGCGLDPMEPRTHMVVDIGGGTSEVTAFCFGGLLAHRSSRVAGDEMTFAVYEYLRHAHSLVVGELVAEQVKIRAATESGPSFLVEGSDAASGRLRMVTLAVEEVIEALQPVTDGIIQTLGACLEDLPPQAVGDIAGEGVLAFGGGSLTRGLDKKLTDAFGFSIRTAERPLTCVAEGAAQCLTRPAVLDAYGAA